MQKRRITAIAVCFTLVMAIFAPLAVSADGTVVYQLATDAGIQAYAVGTEIDGYVGWDDSFLLRVGDVAATVIESRYGGNGIRISGRTDSWQGLDIQAGGCLGREGITLSDASYTIRVRGTVSGNVPLQLAGGDDPWTGFFGETVSGDFSIEHTFTTDAIMGNGFAARGHIRINNTGANTGDFEIHEIVIARGDSIPDELPGAVAIAEVPADEPELGDVPADNGEEEPVIDEPVIEEPIEVDPVVIDLPVVTVTDGVEIRLQIGNYIAHVDGQAQTLVAAPFIGEGDRTMVPFRFIGEAMGATVTHTDATANRNLVAHFVLGANAIDLEIGVRLYDDAGVYMGTPVIVGASTLVPARFVAERMGGVVAWDGGTQTVTITMN